MTYVNALIGIFVSALILKALCVFWYRTHGDLVSGLYRQILLSLQKVLSDPVRPLCSHYGAVVGLHALGWKVTHTHMKIGLSNALSCACT